MNEGVKKVNYYVKSGNGYFVKFENSLPMMTNAKDQARKFTELELAKATVTGLQMIGFSASIESDEEIALED